MLFGKRDKRKPDERVADLKARVDALRQADEAKRADTYSLDHFLEGDDVLTGRQSNDVYEPSDLPAGEPPAQPQPGTGDYEAQLAAELEKYLQREEARAHLAASPDVTPDHSQESGPAEGASSRMDGTGPFEPLRRDGLTAADRAWQIAGSPPDLPDEERSRTDGEDTESGPHEFRNWPEEEQWPPRERAG